MFLELPYIRYNDDLDMDEEITLQVNPFHIVTIEPDPVDKNYSLVWFVNGSEVSVPMPVNKLKRKIQNYLRENVLTKVYKEMRDTSN